ncbi:MAG: NAD(P)/FAD-dependent oxidoreductase [Magnetococcales bacterium]|nr:NAD(P)/FAD-dependent oxidoreductase [Magnetococcales bacterium]
MIKHYDVVVVGSGLGGLVAGALAARSGAKVIVFERHSQVGGAATKFIRGQFSIDASLHQIDGFNDADPKIGLFKRLGLFDHITLIPVPELYAVHHPLLGQFVMPSFANRNRDAVISRFPAHKQAIHQWFDTLDCVYNGDSVSVRHAGSVGKFVKQLRTQWSLACHKQHGLGKWLDSLFGDHEDIKIALCANLPYYGDDPDRLSMHYFAEAQSSFYQGNHYIRSGSGHLSDMLANIIRNHGGEVQCGQTVRQILVEKNRASGVVCSSLDGSARQEVSASLVFANAAPMVVADMLPAPERQIFYATYSGFEPSTSLWCIYLQITGNPKDHGLLHHSTFLFPTWMTSLRHYRDAAPMLSLAPGQRLPPYVVVNHSAIDSGLSCNGTHLVTLTGLDRLSNWDVLDKRAYGIKKRQWMQSLIHDFSERFAGIGERIVMREMATARTMSRYLNTPNGAVYGFAQTPVKTGRVRPDVATPIKGLWLSSAFAMPGGGITGAMLAGQRAWYRAAAVATS